MVYVKGNLCLSISSSADALAASFWGRISKKKFLNRREGPEVPLDFADSGFVLIKCLK